MKQWNKHHGKILDSKNDYDVIDCLDCKFKHLIPIPHNSLLNSHYKHKFYEKRPGLEYKLQEDFDWWKNFYNEKYDYLEKYLNTSSKTLLDVGCGLGYFMLVGKNRGWETTGIDLSEKSIESAKNRGLNAIHSELKEGIFSDEQFDVVHMQEVLEHMPDPIKSLKLVKRFLKPSGLICIVSPNDFNPLQKLLKKSGYPAWWVSPIEHINYFDVNSLENLLKTLEFEILLKTTTFPMELFLMMGDNYVQDSTIGTQMHQKRKNLEFLFHNEKEVPLKQKIYHSLSKLNIGREILIIARKKND